MMELHFELEVVDEWPPVAIEGVPCSPLGELLKIASPPFFVKNISVGDVVEAAFGAEGNVKTWKHRTLSSRSTIWLLRMAPTESLQQVIDQLQQHGCCVVSLSDLGCYSIDVPAELHMSKIDACLSNLDSDFVAIAYPSFRHDEP